MFKIMRLGEPKSNMNVKQKLYQVYDWRITLMVIGNLIYWQIFLGGHTFSEPISFNCRDTFTFIIDDVDGYAKLWEWRKSRDAYSNVLDLRKIIHNLFSQIHLCDPIWPSYTQSMSSYQLITHQTAFLCDLLSLVESILQKTVSR